MNIQCFCVYGSNARGDADASSDVDCFGIHDEAKYRTVTHGNFNMVLYPLPLAKKIMLEGNLFALHLKQEAIPLSNQDLFHEITSLFKYKENYSYEIQSASMLLDFILKNEHKIFNKPLLNQRLSWCIRTILISKSAEERNPVFSKEKIAAKYNTTEIPKEDIINLINLKRRDVIKNDEIKILHKFQEKFSSKIQKNLRNKFVERTMFKLINGTGISSYSENMHED